MTEDEAKERWCPFAMVPTTLTTAEQKLAATGNRGTAMDQPYESARCIGSECMAWRWHVQVDSEHSHVKGPTVPKPDGYCGLAGKP